MAIGDIFNVVVRQKLHLQTVLNVLYYKEIATGTGDAAIALGNAVIGSIIPQFKAAQSNELTHEGITVQKIFPLPPLTPVLNATATGPGGQGQNSLPTSVSAVITRRTKFAGRKYRGRVFVAGVPASFETDSVVNATGIASYQVLADQLALNQGSGGWTFTPIIWHRATKTSDDVTSGLIRVPLRNQRRRQFGRGE